MSANSLRITNKRDHSLTNCVSEALEECVVSSERIRRAARGGCRIPASHRRHSPNLIDPNRIRPPYDRRRPKLRRIVER
jgi:hypothetical protein